MTTRGRLVASGVAVVAIYVAAAAWSGGLSPLARRPLLDGTVPPTPYRWVEPPPALATDNRPPTPGTFRAELADAGTDTEVFTTDDAQVTLILAEGAFGPAADEDAVEITVTPIGATEVEPVDRPLELLGNVVRLEATAEPSGDPVRGLDGEIRVVLVYPFELNQHGGHSLVWSGDGETWTTLETNDLPSIQQADAVIPDLGLVAVAREPAPPTTPPADASSGTVATVAIVAGLVVLVVAVAVVLFGKRAPESAAKQREPKRRVTPEQRKKRRRR